MCDNNDANMADLVKVLDALPHVKVEWYCGGHLEPQDDETEAGDFDVGFVVKRCLGAWTDLAVVNEAISRVTTGHIHLMVGTLPDIFLVPLFQIYSEGADPDELARLIGQVMNELLRADREGGNGKAVH